MLGWFVIQRYGTETVSKLVEQETEAMGGREGSKGFGLQPADLHRFVSKYLVRVC